jgi:hypothetical protein
MIFAVEDHLEQIARGEKTQTRRTSPRYKMGCSYAIQRGRCLPADPRGRIRILRVREEKHGVAISEADADAEGGYSPDLYESLYAFLNPNWMKRFAYTFRFERAGEELK